MFTFETRFQTTHRRIQEVGLGAFFKADPASSTALAGLEWFARSAFNAAEGAGLCPVCDCMYVRLLHVPVRRRQPPSIPDRASWRRAQTQPFFQIAPACTPAQAGATQAAAVNYSVAAKLLEAHPELHQRLAKLCRTAYVMAAATAADIHVRSPHIEGAIKTAGR